MVLIMKIVSPGVILSCMISIGLHAQIPVDEREVSASSTLPPSSTSSFSPDNLMDQTAASWSEGAKGPGVGESFEVFLKYRDYLDFVAIKNGFGNPVYWGANNRIKKLRITAESGEFREILLEDTPEMRVYGTIELIDDPFGDLQEGEPMYGSKFTFEILSVYKGDRWDDACITEIAFNEWYSEHFALETGYINKNLYRIYLDGVIGPSGGLYIETDYEGLQEIEVDDGYLYLEITSGDGTTGHKEYLTFLDRSGKKYIMFQSVLLKYMGIDPDRRQPEDFDSQDHDQPEWREMQELTYAFSFNIPGSEVFFDFEEDQFVDLFDVFPLDEISLETGREVGPEEIWMTCGAGEDRILVIYPADNIETPEVILNYRWNGTRFLLESIPGN